MSDSIDDLDDKPTVITKKKVIPAEGHGGAWKIAYADFVTAMMAFFLLLWLLNATTEEQMSGISAYFAPAQTEDGESGIGETLKGLALTLEGTMRSADSRPSVSVALPTFGEEESGENEGEERKDVNLKDVEAARVQADKNDQEQLAQAMSELVQSIQDTPEISELQESVLVEQTPEGLRIQILDQDKRPMFEENSPELTRYSRRLLALVGSLIVRLPNSVSITGHTELNDFSEGPNFGNWELSSERAVVARNWLVDAGLGPERLVNVIGKGSTDPVDYNNPSAARNRRISILLVREALYESLDNYEPGLDRVE